MTEEQKAPYVLEAQRMEAARQELKQEVLKGKCASQEHNPDGVLSVAQIKRMNQARLDNTLARVSGHAVWKSGLALQDHISGLRASLVLPVPDAPAFQGVKRKYCEAFGYDHQVIANPPLPTFIRPCCTVHAGTCRCDPHFDVMVELVQQFHAGVLAQKLGGSPFLVELQPLDEQAPVLATWLIVATVALRPLCHVVVYLHDADGQLQLTLQNASIRLGTMHRVLRSLLSEATRRAVAVEELRVQVAQLSSWLQF